MQSVDCCFYISYMLMISEFQMSASLSNIHLIAGKTFNTVNTTLKVFFYLADFEVNYILCWLFDM